MIIVATDITHPLWTAIHPREKDRQMMAFDIICTYPFAPPDSYLTVSKVAPSFGVDPFPWMEYVAPGGYDQYKIEFLRNEMNEDGYIDFNAVYWVPKDRDALWDAVQYNPLNNVPYQPIEMGGVVVMAPPIIKPTRSIFHSSPLPLP